MQMDSLSFHFERMTNLDLHPLSLPVSRLSPAKSTSSIDQFTHHHSKGDSAYSSFSGGSSAPDYPSPFLQDELQPHNLHYTDLKYVKAVYNPNVLDADTKSLDQLYRSMEAISKQYGEDDINNCLMGQDPPPLAPPLAQPPPPPPARLDSFVTIRNLENSRTPQTPEGQISDMSYPRLQAADPFVPGSRPDPVYSRRVSQRFQRDPMNRDVSDKSPDPQKSANILSRLPARSSQSQSPQPQQAQSGQSEKFRKKSESGHGQTEQQSAINSWQLASNMINGSIQHKGQFYFVTGTYKTPEFSAQQTSYISDGANVEPHVSGERDRCHSVTENMPGGVQQRKRSSTDPRCMKEFLHRDQVSRIQEEPSNIANNTHNSSRNSEQTSPGPDGFEHGQKFMNWEIGRQHTTSHPIFYCGPEESLTLPPSNAHSQVNPSATEQITPPKNDDQVKRVRRHPLGEVPSEKINKETTPLLYHLTGANRGVMMNKFRKETDKDAGCIDSEWKTRNHRKVGQEGQISDDSRHGETSKEEISEIHSHSCNTLDDSYNKYYKEKLKDAQSKVLKETSFKRKDLQLSLPLRIKPRAEERPSVLSSSTPTQEVQPQVESPTHPLLMSQGMDKENMKETAKGSGREREREVEKQNGKPQNVAQPQVARIGGRKRLTPEQKKLSHSEPEKLHQLDDGPAHATCLSLGSELETRLAEHDWTAEGLVATRLKMFEVRDSSISKTSLKNLQHKALVAYMERKTGQKVTDPQQPEPQVQRQRLSTAGRPSDSGSRAHSGNVGPKKKQHRPLSAGRILDSSSSSARYAQFSTAQPSGHSRQSSWREAQSSSIPGPKSASVESLLDQPEHRSRFRARSTSTPHAFEVLNTSSFINPVDTSIAPVTAEEEKATHTAVSVPDERRSRRISQRGKSMEELGASKVNVPPVLSKSSEQLDSFPARHKRIVSFSDDELANPYRQHFLQQAPIPVINCKDVGPKTQLSKDSDPSASPEVASSLPHDALPVSLYSSSSSSKSSNTDALVYEDQVPPLPHCLETAETETRVVSASGPVEVLNDSKCGSSKVKVVTQMQASTKEGSPEEENEAQSSNSAEEVSLGIGVTTDRSLWISLPEAGEGEEENKGTSSNESTETPCSPPTQPSIELQSATPQAVTDLEGSQSAAEDGEEEKTELEKEAVGPASETENKEEDNPNGRKKWEVLVEEVVSADQSLARALWPVTNRKTALMLMEQLLSEDSLLMEEHYKKKQEQKVNDTTQAASSSSEVMENAEKTSNQSSQDGVRAGSNPQPQTAPTPSAADLKETKRQLIVCIEERLRALEESLTSLQGEERENRALGDATEALVGERCSPAELERYKLFVGDLERVVSLLLCLSARLARVQNALSTVDEHTDAEEKQSLDNRHRLLCKQREDAKDLKDNLDRRERLVSAFLAKQLTAEQLGEYRRFVQTKASLLIRQKDLDERRRVGEEQLEALLNSMPS